MVMGEEFLVQAHLRPKDREIFGLGSDTARSFSLAPLVKVLAQDPYKGADEDDTDRKRDRDIGPSEKEINGGHDHCHSHNADMKSPAVHAIDLIPNESGNIEIHFRRRV